MTGLRTIFQSDCQILTFYCRNIYKVLICITTDDAGVGNLQICEMQLSGEAEDIKRF